MEESSSKVEKTLWEKEKLLIMSNFSFTHSVFKRLVLQTCKNQGLLGKWLSLFPVVFTRILESNTTSDWLTHKLSATCEKGHWDICVNCLRSTCAGQSKMALNSYIVFRANVDLPKVEQIRYIKTESVVSDQPVRIGRLMQDNNYVQMFLFTCSNPNGFANRCLHYFQMLKIFGNETIMNLFKNRC